MSSMQCYNCSTTVQCYGAAVHHRRCCSSPQTLLQCTTVTAAVRCCVPAHSGNEAIDLRLLFVHEPQMFTVTKIKQFVHYVYHFLPRQRSLRRYITICNIICHIVIVYDTMIITFSASPAILLVRTYIILRYCFILYFCRQRSRSRATLFAV